MPASDHSDVPIVQVLLAEIESALKRSGFSQDHVVASLPEIRNTLIETAQAPTDQAEGQPTVIKGGRFYGLKDMGGQVIESGVKLAIAAILAGHGHLDAEHAKNAVVDCVIGLRKTILKLDDAQKVVCIAIMNITSRKRSKIFIEPGASESEIKSYARERDEALPPDLGKILAALSLAEPKVLDAARYGDRGPFYQVRF